ncbi:hypothetical protein HYPSUDRAFT_92993, partial [Hypholoma sublateritium FD-334 SS-4]
SVNNAGPSVAVTQPSDIGTRPPARIGRIVRPDNLPHSVLWSIEDTRQYEGLTTRSNKSRPKMELCIRKPNGEIISTPEYNGLQKLVRRVVADKLLTLPIPKDPAAASGQRTRRWYQRWYFPIYRDAITELEGAEPLLALCGGSWKADQLVGHHLYWQATRDHATNESANIGQKRGLEDTRDFEEDQSHDRETSIPLPSDLPPTENLRHTNGDVSKSSNRLDIDFIQIDKACKFLDHILSELSTDFPNMTTIANLFDAMEANPHFTDKPPSTTVVHFIDTLEAADPNSPDLSEDETDAQWGHKQLSGIWKGVLTSWDAIGCCDVAT